MRLTSSGAFPFAVALGFLGFLAAPEEAARLFRPAIDVGACQAEEFWWVGEGWGELPARGVDNP